MTSSQVFSRLLTGVVGTGLSLHVQSEECISEMEFVVTNTIKYSPFLQELTSVRPLRMQPPKMQRAPIFAMKAAGLSLTQITSMSHVLTSLTIFDTGPLPFKSRRVDVTVGEGDEVTFVRNSQYWDGVPYIETLVIKRYESSEAVVSWNPRRSRIFRGF
jgi:ABC-type transport system substrate-binding protein